MAINFISSNDSEETRTMLKISAETDKFDSLD